METLTYRITGLDCPNCTARIERVIGKVNGVKSVRIDFASGRTVIETDRDDGTIRSEIEGAVGKAEPKAVFVRM